MVKELAKLRDEDAGEFLGEEVRELYGVKLHVKKKRYILSDGTEVIRTGGQRLDEADESSETASE